jgi:hypothetical protein
MSNNQSANAELTVDVILMSSDFPLLPFTYFDSHFDILNHILLVQIIFIYICLVLLLPVGYHEAIIIIHYCFSDWIEC